VCRWGRVVVVGFHITGDPPADDVPDDSAFALLAGIQRPST